MPFVFLAFILVPVAEIGLFIKVGGFLGLWPTLGIVILTAFLGTSLLRAQGLAVFSRAQIAMAEGRLPVEEVVHGFCLVIAGALLLTPGFLTDAIGLLLFIPPVRLALGRLALRWFSKHGTVKVYGMHETSAGFGTSRRQPETTGDIIEGQADVLDPPRRPENDDPYR